MSVLGKENIESKPKQILYTTNISLAALYHPLPSRSNYALAAEDGKLFFSKLETSLAQRSDFYIFITFKYKV